MESTYSDLVNVRNGIETILSSRDVGQFLVTKVIGGIPTIDTMKRKELGRRLERWYRHEEILVKRYEAVSYVDQNLTTMVLADNISDHE